MKKLLFVLPALVFAFFFAFCSKSEVKEELGSLDSGLQASDRGKCSVRIDIASASELVICNTNSNLIQCTSCGQNPQGVGQIVTAGVSPIFLNLATPTTFYVASATGNSVLLTTASNVLGPVNIPAGTCRTFTVDNDCTIH